MSTAKECRICHKGDIYGAKGILLTCGQCKRHTHHSCLLPPMSNPHLLLLLKAITGPGAKQFGHPEIWMCPRCYSRYPNAAKKTVIGKELAKQNSTHSSSATPPAGPSRPIHASSSSKYKPQDDTKDTQTKSNTPIQIITEDYEVIDVEMTPLPSASTATHVRRSTSNNMMKIDSDDEIQEVVGPSRGASSSRQTTQPPRRSKGLNSLNASRAPPSQPSVSSAAASVPLLPTSLLHTKRPSANAFGGFASASTSNPRSATRKPLPNVVTQRRGSFPIAWSSQKSYGGGQEASCNSAGPSKESRSRRRKTPATAYAHSDSSDGTPNEPDLPEKRLRLDSGQDRVGSGAQLDAKLAASPVTAADIRAIHAELRAEGLVRPPPMNFYTLRDQVRLNAQAHSTTSEIESSTIASGSNSQSRSAAHRIPNDDSDIEELPAMKPSSRELPRSDVKGMQRARSPLFVPSSEDEDDEKPDYPQRLGSNVKGKGHALPQSRESDEEEQVAIKLEVFDSLDLGEKSRSTPCNNSNSKKRRSPEPVGMFPQVLNRNKRMMEDKYENEDDQAFATYRFRIVERHESGEGVRRKTVDKRMIRRLVTPEREMVMKEGVQLVKTRHTTTVAPPRQIPSWML